MSNYKDNFSENKSTANIDFDNQDIVWRHKKAFSLINFDQINKSNAKSTYNDISQSSSNDDTW